MSLIAHTTNGMNTSQAVPVRKISVWINRDCTQEVNQQSVDCLLQEAEKSGKMQVYVSGLLEGCLDASQGSPLYCNGQEDVIYLEQDGKIIWERDAYSQCQECRRSLAKSTGATTLYADGITLGGDVDIDQMECENCQAMWSE